MNRFSNEELADMIYVYGAAGGNGRAAGMIYLEHFPNRCRPSHTLFGQLFRRLHEAGAFQTGSHIGRERTTRRPVVEEAVLREFEKNLGTSLRAVKRVLGVHRSSIMRILHEVRQHAYHIQRVQALGDDDYSQRVARWYLQKRVAQMYFPSRILLTDEASLTWDGVLNLRNIHVWAHENPRCTCSFKSKTFQHKRLGRYYRGHVNWPLPTFGTPRREYRSYFSRKGVAESDG